LVHRTHSAFRRFAVASVSASSAELHRRSAALSALLLGAAALVACSADETLTLPAAAQPVGTSDLPAAAAAAAGVSGAQPPSAAVTSGRPAPAAGRMPGVGEMRALGSTRIGAAGMMAAVDAADPGQAGSASVCNSTSPDANSDGTPDCMEIAMERPSVDASVCSVGPIPPEVRSEYELDAFYTRYASADGTPIVATDNPEDEAIRRACLVVLDLSSTQPMARAGMRSGHVYFIMMAKTEKTVDTPEYRSRGDLDARARGFGNNPGLCAEENVMCDRMTDRWRGESICVHEYSHVMHLYVWNNVDPTFDDKVDAAYRSAVGTMGKYANTYAASNAVEYFAEGVQNWYNTNLESSRGEAGDGVHNHINTRAEFKEYDPMLYELLSTVLPDVPKYKDCYYYE